MPGAWRLADPEFAKTTQQILSGEGARRFGGRWNSPGRSAVYLSRNLGTATVELLVHLKNKPVLNKYHKLRVDFPETVIITIDEKQLPDNWQAYSIHPVTQWVGDDWLDQQESLILQVPSIAVPGEWNYVLNPLHPNIAQLQIGTISVYEPDQRLRK